jgi:hypothetical protein
MARIHRTNSSLSVWQKLAVLMAAACLAPTAFAVTIAQSNFDSGTEGWGFAGDGTNMTWHSSGGQPGGYINGVDQASGAMWRFLAPGEYTGNLSYAYGGMLSYSLRVSGNNGWQPDGGDVFLVGDGKRLAGRSGGPPGTSWEGRSVQFSTEGDWRHNTLNGAVATEQEIRDVLASLTALEIRGEYWSGSDNADLDSVLLTSASAPVPGLGPAGLVILALTVLSLGLIGRRKLQSRSTAS